MVGRRLSMDPKGNLVEGPQAGATALVHLERFARHAERLGEAYAKAAAEMGGQARLEGAADACKELAEFAREAIDEVTRAEASSS